MADQNGQLPANELAPISGGGTLRKDAAAAFNAMYAVEKVHVRDSYRPLGRQGDRARGIWSQWAAWETYEAGGNLAAYPGTSNHGWGTAIDVSTPADRAVIDQIGAKFGWSKAWSDAQNEWWHIVYQPGHYNPPPADPYSYFKYATGPFQFGLLKLNERAVVQEFDSLGNSVKDKARRLVLKVQIKFLRDRVWTVAHWDNPPSWQVSYRGWRWQRLNDRLNGVDVRNK